jgi:hypothetical protein
MQILVGNKYSHDLHPDLKQHGRVEIDASPVNLYLTGFSGPPPSPLPVPLSLNPVTWVQAARHPCGERAAQEHLAHVPESPRPLEPYREAFKQERHGYQPPGCSLFARIRRPRVNMCAPAPYLQICTHAHINITFWGGIYPNMCASGIMYIFHTYTHICICMYVCVCVRARAQFRSTRERVRTRIHAYTFS